MRGLVVSLLVHAGFIAAGVIYLPRAAQLLETTPYVPIELVTLAETTNVTAAAPEPEPEPEEEVVEEPVEEEPTLEDEIVDPAPEPEEAPEPEPEPAVITPDPVEDDPAPEPELEPEPEPEPAREEPRRPEPAAEETSSEPDLFDLLGDLEREVDQARDERASEQSDVTRRAVGDGESMTATIAAMVQNHILQQRCFRISSDIPYPEERVVTVVLDLNRDGTLSRAPRIDQARSSDRVDQFQTRVRERALQAAVMCEPYPLPPAQYSEWRQIRVNFSSDNTAQ